MSNFEYFFNEHLSESYDNQELIDFIFRGGEIPDKNIIKKILEKDESLLLICKEQDTIVATATIKMPNQGYPRKTFEKAGCNELLGTEDDWRELGYIHVDENFRGKGLSAKIVQKIIEKFNSNFNNNTFRLYATTRNKIMMHVLKKENLKKCGQNWITDKKKEPLSLFIYRP